MATGKTLRPLDAAQLTLVAAIWGLNFLVIRWGLDSVPPLLFTALRFVFCAVPWVFFLEASQCELEGALRPRVRARRLRLRLPVRRHCGRCAARPCVAADAVASLLHRSPILPLGVGATAAA